MTILISALLTIYLSYKVSMAIADKAIEIDERNHYMDY